MLLTPMDACGARLEFDVHNSHFSRPPNYEAEVPPNSFSVSQDRRLLPGRVKRFTTSLAAMNVVTVSPRINVIAKVEIRH